ncbi:MAG: hypothetical protein A2157_18570 [Deltaproteobacteria bacterium RBG_16_47_11]|nr:MAG: hypothetical protein A2157_18570 [Deltaproteobacteria bacterium RBG_16_47_11]
MKSLFARMLPILACGVLFPGCVGKAPLPSWVLKISMIKAPVGPEEILRLPEGDLIPFAQLLNDLHTTRVIFIGESHDQIEHHQIQVRMIQDLVAKGKDVVIGMEMFERSQQAALDRWSQGLLTEEEFLKEVQWDTTWGVDYALYKDILDEAKNHHLKVLGLNVPRDLVRKVAENGIGKLHQEDEKMLPEMDLTNQQHRTYVKSIYKDHKEGSAEDFEKFYQAQCLWDEGMAESLSTFMKSSEEEERTVLVFAGSGHIVFGFGIPKRFHRRTPTPYQTIVLKAWREKMDADFTFTGASSPLANFLWITKPNPPEKKRPMIGVILKTKENSKGLWIERVLPGSPAEKAGLLPGDQLIAVEGIEVREVKEIHHALSEKGWGNDITFTIYREGKKKEITVQLPLLEG